MPPMRDADLRGRLLKLFYDRRHNADGWVPASDVDPGGGEFVERQAIAELAFDNYRHILVI
jgi:hypothetical protein